ncbi:MAG: hypothetical protein ACRENI_10350 [Gemmatimonadaceae bacterium]
MTRARVPGSIALDATEQRARLIVSARSRTMLQYKTARRPTRVGLTIQFETRPDDSELARLVETTVWVNDAHPAYRRAAASRSEGYHIALSDAMALAGLAGLAGLAAEPSQEHAFVTAFLAHWGESTEHRSARRGKRSRR